MARNRDVGSSESVDLGCWFKELRKIVQSETRYSGVAKKNGSAKALKLGIWFKECLRIGITVQSMPKNCPLGVQVTAGDDLSDG